MRFSVQTDNFELIKEAVESDCNGIRFGSEFCEWKIPALNTLTKTVALTHDSRKEFTYVTPLLSNNSLEKIEEHLTFLDSIGKINVVFNDFGTLNILERHPNLKPCLGRQIVAMPARCPWPRTNLGFFERRHVDKVFYQTSLNYEPTIQFYQKYRIESVDIDWISQCFSYIDFLVEKGLKVCVHTHSVPVAVTRRCHMARFLGEKSPQSCSKPCDRRAFRMKQNTMDMELYSWGNAVFKLSQPSRKDLKKLNKSGSMEFIITMNPLTKVENRRKINELIEFMSNKVSRESSS